MAYQPSNSGCTSAGTTIKDQQMRYFCAWGDTRSPRTIFFEQLITQLLLWKAIDNNIVLLGDFNENIYTGHLATRLTADDLNFVELCRKHTGTPISPTDLTTPGITCIYIFILPQYGGVGNHWCFIIDLTSESMIGTSFPNIVWWAARKLHCTSYQMINLYNAELTSVCDRHDMFHCMDQIIRHTMLLTKDDFTQIIDSWDVELMQFMLIWNPPAKNLFWVILNGALQLASGSVDSGSFTELAFEWLVIVFLIPGTGSEIASNLAFLILGPQLMAQYVHIFLSPIGDQTSVKNFPNPPTTSSPATDWQLSVIMTTSGLRLSQK